MAIGSFASLSFRSGHALKIYCVLLAIGLGLSGVVQAEGPVTLLRAAQVFDGEVMHAGWIVLVEGNSMKGV